MTRGWFGDIFSREFAFAILIAALVVAVGWVGFIASDDQYYYSAALKWLGEGWYLPDHFGRIRNAVSLPIAWSILLFGDREFAVIVPSVAYYLAVVALTFVCISRIADRTMAFLACAVFATFPVVATAATTASSDIAELFWALLAFWLFFYAWRGGRLRVGALFGCGVAMALAFSGRENVIALGMFVAGAILLGGRIGRAQIVWVGAGGLTVLGLEALYYTLAGGDPLLRLSLFLDGASSSDRPDVAAFSVDSSGSFRVHPLVDPILLVLTRQFFGLGYWVFVAVLLLSLRGRQMGVAASGTRSDARELQILALAAGVMWFLFVAVAMFRIRLLGRYYITPAWFLAVGSAAFLFVHQTALIHPRRLWLAASCVVAVNFAGIVLQNNNPRLVERELVAFAASSREPVFTDPYTARYAAEFLHWAGVPPEQVVGAPPTDGALYFVVPSRIASPNRLTPASMLPALQVRPEWTVLRRIEGPTALPTFVVQAVRAAPFIPEGLRTKLAAPRGSLLVVRVSARATR